MSDTNALTTLSDGHYPESPEYKVHVENMLASYDHPTGILRELVSQMADAFWWVRVYRAEKDQLLITKMANELVQRNSFREETLTLWLEIYEIIAALAAGQAIDAGGRQLLEEVLESNGHNLDSLRAAGLRAARSSYETLDRLIERQLKNVKLLIQAYDSVRFAPQIHKRMALEIEQLEQQVKHNLEGQRLEVDRQ